jgi:hypothetical protein
MKSWQRKFCAILALDSTFFASSSKRRFALNNDDRGESDPQGMELQLQALATTRQ